MIIVRDDNLGIEVTGETGREASRKLAAERRRLHKAEKARKASRKLARLEAGDNARRLYEWLAEIRLGQRGHFPRGIRRADPFEQFSSCRSRSRERGSGYVVSYDTEDGRIELDHYGYRPRFGVENGAGFCLAVVLDDLDREDEYQVCAVGAHEGEAMVIPMVVPIEELEAAFAEGGG